MKQIVTHDSLADMIRNAGYDKRTRIIGRALVALYYRQTDAEKSQDVSSRLNHRGFCSADAYSGSSAARHFLQSQQLTVWEINRWLATNPKTKRPYICKYARQLNEIANEKRQTVG